MDRYLRRQRVIERLTDGLYFASLWALLAIMVATVAGAALLGLCELLL